MFRWADVIAVAAVATLAAAHLAAADRPIAGAPLDLVLPVEAVDLAVSSLDGGMSIHTNRVTLHLQRGKVRLGVAPVVFAGLEMRVTTPETEVDLAEGSYTFQVTTQPELTDRLRSYGLLGSDWRSCSGVSCGAPRRQRVNS